MRENIHGIPRFNVTQLSLTFPNRLPSFIFRTIGFVVTCISRSTVRKLTPLLFFRSSFKQPSKLRSDPTETRTREPIPMAGNPKPPLNTHAPKWHPSSKPAPKKSFLPQVPRKGTKHVTEISFRNECLLFLISRIVILCNKIIVTI